LDWENEVTLVSTGAIDAMMGSIGDVTPPLVRLHTDATLVNSTVDVQVRGGNIEAVQNDSCCCSQLVRVDRSWSSARCRLV